MAISAWVAPDYSNGSPEFTVVSKGKSFVLSINNLWKPQKIAKFAVFDGIKWTTVESTSTIPEGSWSHLTARFNKTSIEIYVNGTMEASESHNGVPFVNEKGQIELKTLEEITSYSDIVIGASITPDMKSSAFNMFSGLIDGVQLFDYQLEPADVANLFQETIPIKTVIPSEPVQIGIPVPVLRYRIFNTTKQKLPEVIPNERLKDPIDQLTVTTWVKPNYTDGSPEFTIASQENAFSLALNKMIDPQNVAKFSVFDGISWYTVIGNTPVNSATHIAGVINGSVISVYVNGTLDGRIDTGVQRFGGSTSDVLIGAYQSTLRSETKQYNFYSGIK